MKVGLSLKEVLPPTINEETKHIEDLLLKHVINRIYFPLLERSPVFSQLIKKQAMGSSIMVLFKSCNDLQAVLEGKANGLMQMRLLRWPNGALSTVTTIVISVGNEREHEIFGLFTVDREGKPADVVAALNAEKEIE